MRREEGTRILVDRASQYNRSRGNCENVTFTGAIRAVRYHLAATGIFQATGI